MPVVVPAELPTADVVVVVPDDGGQVVVLVDTRLTVAVGAAAIADVRRILRGPGDLLTELAKYADCVPHAVG